MYAPLTPPTPAIRVGFKAMHFDVFLYLCAKYGAHSRPEEAASQRPQREEVVADESTRSWTLPLGVCCFFPVSYQPAQTLDSDPKWMTVP